MKRILLILTIVFLVSFVSCGMKSDEFTGNTITTEDSKEELYDETLEGEGFADENYSDNMKYETERKIIKKANITIETLVFDEAIKSLDNSVGKNKGYIEASDIYQPNLNDKYSNRSGNYTIRIPKEEFDNFINEIGSMGIITNKNIYGEDVSESYYDAEARLKVLKAQENRYIELIDEANTITEILEIEKYLTDVRTDIELLDGRLKNMDNRIEYSTIDLCIIEVKEETIIAPDTLGGKITKTFKESIRSLKNLSTIIILVLIALVPYMFIVIPVCLIVYLLIRRKREKNKK